MASYAIVALMALGIFIQIYFFDYKSKNMPSNLRLHYFDGVGRGEPVRMILNYAKIPFEDVRIPRDQWLNFKPDMPFGQVPMMEIEGKQIPQSIALCRYFAKQTDLIGKTDLENLEIDMIVDTVVDFYIKLIAFNFEPDANRKKTLGETVVKTTIPFYLTKFDARIKKNGGYLGLNRFTWADIIFLNVYESMINWTQEDVTSEYPNIGVLKKNFLAVSGIRDHLKTRPSGPPFYNLQNEL